MSIAPVLLLLISVLAGLLVAAIAAFSLFRGRKQLAGRLAIALLAAFSLYLAATIGVALASEQKVIALGGEKHICEIDCHVAYAVQEVATAAYLGPERTAVRPKGRFHVVTLRTRFDAETTSERRPEDARLYPGSRIIRVVDADGRTYDVSPEGQAALGGPPPAPDMLTRPLLPGESFTTQLVFDLPADVREPMLLIQDTDWTKWGLIGSETFPLHKKALLRLTPGPGVKDVAA